MTPEEMQKKIEFILEMQAQFAANMTRSEANIDNLRVSVADLRVTVADLTGSVARSEANINNLRVSVADLAGVVRESIRLSDDRCARLDERMMELATAQKTTEERLNALINVVERHITGPDHAPRP